MMTLTYKSLSYVYGLPPAIRVKDHSDPEVWARNHLHLGPSVDMHIAASIQLCKLKDYWGSVCESKSPDPAYIDLAIETLTAQCDSLVAKWFSEEAPPPGFDQEAEHVLKWSILDFIFIMRRYRLEVDMDDPLRLDACLAVASQIAGELDVLAGNGELEIMQDTASCMTAALVNLLRKVFRRATRSQKSNILSLLHRLLLSHVGVSQDDSNSATAYVTRFLRRILSALGAESRRSSPKPAIESTILDNADEQYDFFAQLGLEEFLEIPEHVTQSEGNDEQYWALLFSA
ncbi:hypothetical protein BCR39DRAFT_552054 [Naematelia encephala]|uniref:Uncharacterized protein n=1 Tax=Naematelia encephala TaxID=71784 RepID=A0A1Y2AHY1_9TREE|nr:hypothetical protein BCR39DRAFT_552054 [Naematelia encephala]